MINFNFQELDLAALKFHKQRLISSNKALNELIGYLNNEKTELENEKKTLQIHTEELIRILTHLNIIKPEQKKKKGLIWNKSGQKKNKSENKTMGKNDKSKNLGSNINEILSEIRTDKEEEKHKQIHGNNIQREKEEIKESHSLEEELKQIRNQISTKNQMNMNNEIVNKK